MSARAARKASFEAIDALLRLSALVERRRRQLARGAGLSDAQWQVLEGISTEHFLPSLFARDRETAPAAVSRTLRQLQERGWIRASIAPGDRRQRAYRLTAKGRHVIEQLRQGREAALEAVWDALPVRDVDRFARFATRLADRLEAHAAEVEAAD
jgi:DNA-binding MarR family transcriptional regulator